MKIVLAIITCGVVQAVANSLLNVHLNDSHGYTTAITYNAVYILCGWVLSSVSRNA